MEPKRWVLEKAEKLLDKTAIISDTMLNYIEGIL